MERKTRNGILVLLLVGISLMLACGQTPTTGGGNSGVVPTATATPVSEETVENSIVQELVYVVPETGKSLTEITQEVFPGSNGCTGDIIDANKGLTHASILQRGQRLKIPPRCEGAKASLSSNKGGSETSAPAPAATPLPTPAPSLSGPVGQNAARIAQEQEKEGLCGGKATARYGGPSGAWCHYFVTWVWNQAGSDMAPDLLSGADVIQLCQSRGRWVPNGPEAQPLPGDLYLKDHPLHDGIFISEKNGDTVVIDGNASDCVKKRTIRNFRQSSVIIGFCRPE